LSQVKKLIQGQKGRAILGSRKESKELTMRKRVSQGYQRTSTQRERVGTEKRALKVGGWGFSKAGQGEKKSRNAWRIV